MSKKIWNTITTVLVVLVVILAVLLVGARIFGLQVFYVMSGSMEPTYHVGSLIYVKKIDPADVKVGDPITFVMEATNENGKHNSGTHRVVEITGEGEKEVTDERTGVSHKEYCYTYKQLGDLYNPEYNPDYKPDAKKFPDYTGWDNADEETKKAILADTVASHGGEVSSANLLGKPIFTIPVLGYVAHFVQNPPGMYIAIAAGAVLLLLVFLPDLISGKKKEQAKPEASPTKAAEAASPYTAETKAAETEKPVPVDKDGE